jgi:hypothetical protein
VSREALLEAITRYRQGALSLGELRAAVAAVQAEGELGDELRRLDAALESIELGVCEADRRGAALEQLEPAARALEAA